MKKYEVILLDADGTLFDYDRAEAYALEKTFHYFEIEHRPDYHLEHYRKINNAVWDEFERELISVEDLKTERFKRLFSKLQLDLNPEDFSNRYLDNLSEAAFLIPGADELVTNLAEDYNLVLVSNGLSKVQNKRLDLSPIKKHFDGIVISEEVGAAKPNPRIFEKALAVINHQNKYSALMVGDSLTSDIQGGIKFGIDTCWFNPDNEKNTSPFKPTYEIHHLHELLDILN